MKFLRIVLLTLLLLCLPLASLAQHVEAGNYRLSITRVKDKEDTFDLVVTDKSGNPVGGLNIVAKASMPSMESMPAVPAHIMPGAEKGHYEVHVNFPHAGDYVLHLVIKPTTGDQVEATIKLPITADKSEHADHQHHEGHAMKGTIGNWSMSREGSGTAWQPDSSPMYMQMLPNTGRYEVHLMGSLQTGYIDAGGERGDEQGYANSMAMWMARRETGGGVLGLHLMLSADAITNGKRGVPNLFQTGETLNGEPLVDRQHPHDMFAEMSVSFNRPWGNGNSVFLYVAPVGEPALGNVMFMHRTSGMENPEAPISHHWFDSTHISFGVATLGITLQDKWKFEGSVFNGREPDEDRYDIESIQFNAASGRISYNPNEDWSLSAAYGYLDSPEALEPGVNVHRLTASAAYNKPLSNGDNFASTVWFGRNIKVGHDDSNALGLEATLTRGRHSIFTRFESVDKDELEGVPEGTYKVQKFVVGDVYNVAKRDGYEYGIGAYLGLYKFPDALKPFYGDQPTTWGVFLRIRPGRM